MTSNISPIVAGAFFLMTSACQSQDESKDPPISVQDVASRISGHAEQRMTELGLSLAEANSCFVKLNADMDAHPNVDLSKVTDDDKAQLAKIEAYQKAFLDKCFVELRSR